MNSSGVYLWAIVGGFLVGVYLRSFTLLGISAALFVVALSLALLALAFFLQNVRRTLVIGAIALLACSVGIVRMHMATVTGDPAVTAAIGQDVTVEGTIVQEPDVRDFGTRVTVAVDTLITRYEKEKVNAGVIVQAPPHVDVSYGDRVLAFGTLELPEAFDTGMGRVFNYPQYLAAQGVEYELSRAQIERQAAGTGNALKYGALAVKHAYLRGTQASLPEPEAGLAGGITVGDKRSIGSELSAEFQRVSLIHMVVLSGYNITVVINAVTSMLSWASSYMRFGAAGIIVAFFVLMSGGAASATRAGLMALLAVYAHSSRRTFSASRALGVVAAGMVAYNPFTLAFDPSFQLSALATAGLIVFSPIFSAWFSRVPEAWGLREIAASTCATQLAVLPLLLYQNGNLSIVALPANLLALAPVPFAMLFSFVAALGGMVFGSYAVVLAAPAYVLLAYIIAVGHLFASLPFAAVSVPAFSAWWLLIAYVLLFGMVAAYYAAHKKETAAQGGGTQLA